MANLFRKGIDDYQRGLVSPSSNERVITGIERARLEGKRIGRPKVVEREGFWQRFQEVVSRIGEGGISRLQAARELNIGYATLKRLIDANYVSLYNEIDNDDPQHSMPSSPISKEGLVMVYP